MEGFNESNDEDKNERNNVGYDDSINERNRLLY